MQVLREHDVNFTSLGLGLKLKQQDISSPTAQPQKQRTPNAHCEGNNLTPI